MVIYVRKLVFWQSCLYRNSDGSPSNHLFARTSVRVTTFIRPKQNTKMKRLTTFPVFLLLIHLSIYAQLPFADVTSQSGLEFNGKNYGVAVGDYNKDGLDDLFAISHNAPCRLYKNNGDGTFTNVAADLGVDYVGTPNAAGWFDANNDGHLDLFIATRDENNVFYLGKEDGMFGDHTFLSGLMMGKKVRALLFSDINLDGLIDIYLARINADNILYLNVGNSQFLNYTNASGTHDSQISMGAVFFDYDNDGDPDLYLTHDANQPNILYQNDGKGIFTDVSVGSGANIGTNGMGVDVADINHDGWLDIYITNLYENSLLLNNGNGTFSNISESAGVGDIGMGWGCTFLDVDNDGWQDIYAVNDSYFAPIPNVLYHNNQDLTFKIISEGSALESLEPSYGVVATDFDNNGNMDIYLTNYVGDIGNQLFKNNSTSQNNWVKINLEGTESNRSAIGARVTIETDHLFLTDELLGTSGYASQNGFTLHFGLAKDNLINKMTIRWPNGLEEIFENLAVNFNYSFMEGEGSVSTHVNENIFLENKMKISPNPFNDKIKVEFNSTKINFYKLVLTDIKGVELKEVYFEKNDLKNEINLSVNDLMPGVYFLKTYSEENVIVEKIIKR